MADVNTGNKMTLGDMIAARLYVGTLGLSSVIACADDKKAAEQADPAAEDADTLVIADSDPISTILSSATLSPLAGSSAAWSEGVTDFLAKANSALTSGTANEYGNFATTVVAGGETIQTDDGGYSDVTYFIMTPGDSDASALSTLSASQLYQDGDVNVDLATVTSYTGAYVMVAVVRAYSADGTTLTGTSTNMMAHNVDATGTESETELHSYYIASAETLIVDLFDTDSGEYSHEALEGVTVEDAEVVAHTDLYTTADSVTAGDVTVPADIAQ